MRPAQSPKVAFALACAIALAIAAGCIVALTSVPRPAHADEPKFGEPGWVAPVAGEIEGEPTAVGPRVADPDHEPTGEKILRTPFRVVFFPVRLLARGTESVVSWAGPMVVSPPSVIPSHRPADSIGPAFNFSGWAGPQVGLGWTHRFDPEARTQFSLSGSYSTKDHRSVRIRQWFGRSEDPIALTLDGRYLYRPTFRFYGVGNTNEVADRSIYLEERGRADAVLRFGQPWRHALMIFGTYLDESARTGYNDGPGVADVFTQQEVDALFGRSRVAGLGIGAELATFDDPRDPTRGLGAQVHVRQMRSVDGGGLDYREWHLETRAYVPVFSSRRVLAFRAVHENVDPMGDSAPIPPRLMPDTDGDLRLKAYRSQQFLDRHLLLGQVEYRWAVWRRLWALGLAQIGETANESRSIRIADVHESYGGGFRYAFTPDAIARMDIAKGTQGIQVHLSMRSTF